MAVFEICLENVKLRGYHGVFDFERTNGNDFQVDLSVKYTAPQLCAIERDELSDTVCYAALFDIVKEEMALPRNLLETVAAAIVSRIKSSYPQCTAIRCKITKLSPPIPDFDGLASVSFSLESNNS